MRKVMVIGSAAATFVILGAVVAAAIRPSISEPMRIHVIEHATTDTVVDTDGDGADSTGDLLTFDNSVFDAANSERVGRSHGDAFGSIRPKARGSAATSRSSTAAGSRSRGRSSSNGHEALWRSQEERAGSTTSGDS